MIAKLITVTGLMCTHYLQTLIYAYNSFGSQALIALSPFQIMYGRALNAQLEIEKNPHEGTFGFFKEYFELLRKMFAYSQKIVPDYRLKQQDIINEDKSLTQYEPRDLVYLISS